jgi:hypothetical protein
VAAPTVQTYAQQVLKGLGAPQTPANVSFFEQWAAREGVPQSVDSYNLLGTTLKVGGSYGTNGPGVQAYGSLADGVTATVRMLQQGNFKTINAAFQSGNPYSYQSDPQIQQEFSSWSGGGYVWPSSSGGAQLGSAPLYSRGTRPSGGSGGGIWGSIESAGGDVLGAANSAATFAVPGLGTVEGIFGSASGAIGDVKDALKIFLWLVSPVHWLMAFEILFGSVLMLVGLFFLGQEAAGIQGADDVGGVKDVAKTVGLGALIPVAGEAKVAKAAAGMRAAKAAARKPGPVSRRPAGERRRAGFEPADVRADREAKQARRDRIRGAAAADTSEIPY